MKIVKEDFIGGSTKLPVATQEKEKPVVQKEPEKIVISPLKSNYYEVTMFILLIVIFYEPWYLEPIYKMILSFIFIFIYLLLKYLR